MMTYYSRKIEMPATRRDGLANFVQMVINCIEAGDSHEALLKAVDLHQDIECGIYDDAMVDTKAANAAAEERKAEAAKAEEAAYHRGYDDGVSTERRRIANLMGLAA